MGLCGTAGACHFLSPQANGYLFWGEGVRWEAGLFQGSAGEGFHNYVVGSDWALGNRLVPLPLCTAVVVV